MPILRSALGGGLILLMLLFGSLPPCSVPGESREAFRLARSVRPVAAHGIHAAAHPSTHTHASDLDKGTIPAMPTTERSAAQLVEAGFSDAHQAISPKSRDETRWITGPCYCGCQRGAPVLSTASTQLSVVAFPSVPDLVVQTIFESRFSIEWPEPAGRVPVPDWIPI